MIYLDANATSHLRPSVVEELSCILSKPSLHGNPSSVHRFGNNSRGIIVRSIESIEKFIFSDQKPKAEIVFTSGATEACNSMISGFLDSLPLSNNSSIVYSSIEHPATSAPITRIGKISSCQLTVVKPDKSGRIDSSEFCSAVTDSTVLVSIMLANNETGVLQPVREIIEELRSQGYTGVIVSDITQAIGKSDIDISELFELGLDAAAFSGHKLGALQGVGCLLIGKCNLGDVNLCRKFNPLVVGGEQQYGWRSGTENLLGIASLGAAMRELSEVTEREKGKVRQARDKLKSLLNKEIPNLQCFSHDNSEITLTNTLSLRFPKIRADDFVVALDLAGVAASSGAACSSGKQSVSYVLLEMGVDKDAARETVRFSLDWSITLEQVEEASRIILQTYKQMLSVQKFH